MHRKPRRKNIRMLIALAEQRLSVREAAAAAGMAPSHFSEILNRRQAPTPATQAKIARALKSTVNHLFPPEVLAYD